MLVVSVFFHFLIFTVLMFFPQTQNTVKKIIPAFTVELINIPTGPQAQPAPPPLPVADEPIPDKPVPEKPVADKPKPLPEKSVAHKSVMSKIEDLATPEKKVAEKKVVQPKKPVLDETFRELESLKAKKAPEKEVPAMKAPKKVKSALDGFDDIKMKTEIEKKKKPTRTQVAKKDLTLKELEFEQLTRKAAADRPKDKPKKSSDLLKEMDHLNKLNEQARAAMDKTKVTRSSPKSNKLLKELEGLRKQTAEIKIDTSKFSAQHSTKFKSEIRKMKIGDFQKPLAGPAASGESGNPAADVLSLYAGKIKLKADANWKNPLGGGTGQVQVSFKVFPNGSIETPKIYKSSGVRKLDNLAVLAIKNAAPFPPFPRELKEPNLPLILRFNYVPSKN